MDDNLKPQQHNLMFCMPFYTRTNIFFVCAYKLDEIARIVDMGGFVANNRLMGQIAVARALGDRHFKSNGSASSLTCEPDIGICQLEDGDEFFLLACDGLFDVCTSQQAVDECRRLLREHNDDIVRVSKLMAEYAIENGSTDNVSVAIVLLEKAVSISGQNEDELTVIYNKDGGIKHFDFNLYTEGMEPEKENSRNWQKSSTSLDENEPENTPENRSSDGSSSPLMIGSEEWDGGDSYAIRDTNEGDNSAVDDIDQLLKDTVLMNTPDAKKSKNHTSNSANFYSEHSQLKEKKSSTQKPHVNRKGNALGLDDDTLDFLMDSNNFEEV